MTKSNRRGWLDKISKWILDAFPGEDSPELRPSSTPPPNAPDIEPAPLPAAAPRTSQQQLSAKANPPQAQQSARSPRSSGDATPPSTDRSTPAASTSSAQDTATEKTLIKAWRAFELAWHQAGLSSHYFLDADELISTLSVLDRTFEE